MFQNLFSLLFRKYSLKCELENVIGFLKKINVGFLMMNDE